MMWITPLPVATSAAASCDVVHRDLALATVTVSSEPCRPPTFSSPASKSVLMILSNRDDMVLRRVFQILACEKLLSSDAWCFRGSCESFVR